MLITLYHIMAATAPAEAPPAAVPEAVRRVGGGLI